MYRGKLILSQLFSFLPKYEFQKCVLKYKGTYKVKSFTCWEQFLCMGFAQITYRESLRDIVSCLRFMSNKLYHLGFRSKISRSTLADANENRDWRIYADFAQILIHHARKLYMDEDFGLQLKDTVYALDSTTIDLCLSLFPWAKFRKTKAAIKLHTLLDIRGNIPVFIKITEALLHDVNILDELIAEPGSIYLFDKAYIDFARLYQLNLNRAFFVTRAKENFKFKRLYSHPIDKSTGLKCDQTILLTGYYSYKAYPEKLRRVRFFDKDTKNDLVFLTNNFRVPALLVTGLYKQRWKVEIFFKWIKQHLRIKSFYGTSENAVKTQIWIAISIYVLIAIVKKQLNLPITLYTFLQILSVSVFEKVDILQLVTETDYNTMDSQFSKQLSLFN